MHIPGRPAHGADGPLGRLPRSGLRRHQRRPGQPGSTSSRSRMAPSGPNDDASREDPFVCAAKPRARQEPMPPPVLHPRGVGRPRVRTRPSTQRVETPRTQHSVTPASTPAPPGAVAPTTSPGSSSPCAGGGSPGPRPHPSVPAPFPGAVAVVDPLRARLPVRGSAHAVCRSRHQRLRHRLHHPGPCPPSRAACAATPARLPSLRPTLPPRCRRPSARFLCIPKMAAMVFLFNIPSRPPPYTTPVDSNESVHPERSRAGRLPKRKARRRMESGPAGLPAPTPSELPPI